MPGSNPHGFTAAIVPIIGLAFFGLFVAFVGIELWEFGTWLYSLIPHGGMK